MLNKAIIAAQFQDTDDVGEVNDGQEDRTFIQFAETARNGLVGPRRHRRPDLRGQPDHDARRSSTTARTLPASLKKPTFAWDGDGADVSAAWNDGRFLVVHRDHGWSDGWGDPFFTTTEVDALTNGNDNLPVVMSINCASAQYDTDETSFVQNALVKPTGGAVGVFGDTRNSPSWHNSQIALGFVDALLPSVLSGEGPATQAARRRRARARQAAARGARAAVGPRHRRRRRQHAQRAVPLALLRRPDDADVRAAAAPPIVFDPASFKARLQGVPDPEARRSAAVRGQRDVPGGLARRPAVQPAAQRPGHRQGARRRRLRDRSPRSSTTARRSPASSRSRSTPTAPRR